MNKTPTYRQAIGAILLVSVYQFCAVSGYAQSIVNPNITPTAQTAFTPPVLNSFGNEPSGNDGLFFTLNNNITVTALGYVAPSSSSGNLVGLYDVTTSTMLISNAVNSSSPATGNFLYQSITPINLTVGDEYAVVGYFTSGSGAVGYTADSGVGAASALNFLGYEYDNNVALDLPSSPYAPAIFGPNFQFIVVPEPQSLALAGLGVFSWLAMRRKLR